MARNTPIHHFQAGFGEERGMPQTLGSEPHNKRNTLLLGLYQTKADNLQPVFLTPDMKIWGWPV